MIVSRSMLLKRNKSCQTSLWSPRRRERLLRPSSDRFTPLRFRNQTSLTRKEARLLRAPMRIENLIMKETLRIKESINTEPMRLSLISKMRLRKSKKMRALLLRKTTPQLQCKWSLLNNTSRTKELKSRLRIRLSRKKTTTLRKKDLLSQSLTSRNLTTEREEPSQRSLTKKTTKSSQSLLNNKYRNYIFYLFINYETGLPNLLRGWVFKEDLFRAWEIRVCQAYN